KAHLSVQRNGGFLASTMHQLLETFHARHEAMNAVADQLEAEVEATAEDKQAALDRLASWQRGEAAVMGPIDVHLAKKASGHVPASAEDSMHSESKRSTRNKADAS